MLVADGETGKGKNGRTILFNKITGKKKIVDTKITSMLSMQVDKNCLYFNAFEGSPCVIAYNLNTDEKEVYTNQDGLIMDKIVRIDDKIINIGFNYFVDGEYEKMISNLFIFDTDNMKEPTVKSFTEYGMCLSDAVKYKDEYYLAIDTEYDESRHVEDSSNKVIVLDSDFEYKRTIKTEFTVGKLFVYDQKVYAIKSNSDEDDIQNIQMKYLVL